MPELIELSRNELLHELMRVQDERDVMQDELQRLKRSELKLAMELGNSRRNADICFWVAFGGLLFGLSIVVFAILRSM